MEHTYACGVKDPVFGMNFEAYKKTPTSYDCLMRNHFNDEISTLADYEGRELYELIQNADDAGSKSLEIRLEGDHLSIGNDGDRPFTQDGYASIMRPSQSTKREEKYIGSKGLGFRSVLNWCDSLQINSRLAPESGKGLSCRFSEDIALQKYKCLREEWQEIGGELEKILREISAGANRKSPMPILAIPEVHEWIPGGKYTTQIVLDLRSDVVAKVKDNLRQLKDSQFFLFLHNIKEIKIICEGEETSVNWHAVKLGDREFVEVTATSGPNRERSTQKWLIVRRSEDKISVAAAKRVDATLPEEENHGYYFHSFFPTKIRLGYGCVLHATVNLDKSRNYILKTPDSVLELLAEATTTLALSVADYYKENLRWDGYDTLRTILLLNPDFEILNNALASSREHKPLCPTVTGGIISLAAAFNIAEEFSRFAEHYPQYSDFGRVLRTGFSTYGIGETLALDSAIIEDFANPEKNPSLSYEERVRYVAMLARLAHRTLQQYKLGLLIDQDGNPINGKGYILTGNNEKVPSILKIRIVKEDIVKGLISELGKEIKAYSPKEAVPNRQLSNYLEKICDIGYTDFNGIKTQLYSASHNEHTREQEVEFVGYLYRQWKQYTGGEDKSEANREFVLPKDDILHLLDANGKPRQICNLVYGSRQNRWAPLVTDWPAELGAASDDEAADIKRFIIEELHMASSMPLRFEDWAYCPKGYLEHFDLKNAGLYRREEVLKSAMTNKRKAFVADVEWLENYDFADIVNFADIVKKIVSDEALFKTIYTGKYGEYLLHYFYYSLNASTVALSPCAYSLRGKLGGLASFVVKDEKWLGEDLMDTSQFTGEEYERFVKLAILMGAKRDYSDLSPDEIYKRVNETSKDGHCELYREFKDILARFAEDCKAPESLSLWCKKSGELLKLPASDCYYWDNTPPKAIRDNYPLFDIGKREGENLVQRLFGVKSVSTIKCVPCEDTAKSLAEMTTEAREIIDSRMKHILACRCESIGRSRAESIKAALGALRNLKFTICESFGYKINNDVYYLEKGEYIVDPDRRYWLVLPNVNIDSDPLVLDTLASMLCNLFRIEEKNWKAKFKDILLTDTDRLEKRLADDFDADYITDISNLMTGIEVKKAEPKPRMRFEDFGGIVNGIQTYRLCKLFSEYDNGEKPHSGFIAEWDSIEEKVEREAKIYYRDIDHTLTIAEIEEALLAKFGLKHSDIEGLKRPEMLSEYDEWIDETFTGNYGIQQYREMHSLAYFPGHLDEMKALWQESLNEIAKVADEGGGDMENDADDTPLPEAVTVTDINLDKPTAVSGNPEKGNDRGGGGKISEKKKAVRGKKAERLVFRYLQNLGGKSLIPRSSNLDSTIKDKYHYDIEYTDSEGSHHYIEVKSTVDGTIHFTEAEMAFAKNHRKEYDLYIVYGGKIHILPQAYQRLQQTRTPEQYRVTFKP